MLLLFMLEYFYMVKHLYIHVPFCKSICAYCDFCHFGFQKERVDQWLDEFENEIAKHDLRAIETVYLGGGTPTCLEYVQLERLLKIIKEYVANPLEYTIEINPETLDLPKAKLLQRYRVNRASIGLQSSNEQELRALGRRHSFADVQRTCGYLNEAGIDNYSLDIMYSIPHETMESLAETIDDALSLKPKHLSLYSLQIEPGTLFYSKGVTGLDEDLEADMYEYIVKRLKEEGYVHYEISNFAIEGFQSRHNLGYWEYNDFIGLSLGASGKENHQRYTNTRSFKQYFNHQYRDEVIDLSLEDEMFEEIMMSLRTVYGVDLARFEKRYGQSFYDAFKEPYAKHKNDFNIIDNHLIVKNVELLNSLLVDFL